MFSRTSDGIPGILIPSRLRTALERKSSIEFCMAVALLDGEVGLRQFTNEKEQDPKVQELIKKVKYRHPESMSGLK